VEFGTINAGEDVDDGLEAAETALFVDETAFVSGYAFVDGVSWVFCRRLRKGGGEDSFGIFRRPFFEAAVLTGLVVLLGLQ